jgi:hypothetical protein
MNDMSGVITPKSDQINADDLLGRTMTITVAAVQLKGGQEQPVSIYFDGSDKAFRPCKSMCRVLVQAWGLDANQYVGKSLTLYCDPTVKFGPLAVGGIRISHMSHIDGPMTMALTATKGVKKAYKVVPLKLEQRQNANAGAAEKWANDHIGFVTGAMTLDRLAEVQASGTKAMAKLATSDPALHDRVTAAYAKRLDELSPATGDDDPFGLPEIEANPATPEGRDETDMGEATTSDIAIDLVDRISSARDAIDVDALSDEFEGKRKGLEETDQRLVEEAIGAAKAAFKGGK